MTHGVYGDGKPDHWDGQRAFGIVSLQEIKVWLEGPDRVTDLTEFSE